MWAHVIYCLAWGDGPNRGCACTAGAKLKSFVMRTDSEFAARQQQIPIFASDCELPFSPHHWILEPFYMWVGFSPKQAFTSLGKRPKWIQFCNNLQWPREVYHAKGNIHPRSNLRWDPGPTAGNGCGPVALWGRVFTLLLHEWNWESAKGLILGLAVRFLGAPSCFRKLWFVSFSVTVLSTNTNIVFYCQLKW